MRRSYSLIIASLLVFASCKKSEVSNHSLIGRWQETETYMSMGGPADWVTSTVYREIEFKSDGRLIGLPEVNRYQLLNDSTLQVWSTNGIYNYTWRIMELTSEKLELSYSCFEGCGGRFIPVK